MFPESTARKDCLIYNRFFPLTKNNFDPPTILLPVMLQNEVIKCLYTNLFRNFRKEARQGK